MYLYRYMCIYIHDTQEMSGHALHMDGQNESVVKKRILQDHEVWEGRGKREEFKNKQRVVNTMHCIRQGCSPGAIILCSQEALQGPGLSAVKDQEKRQRR